MNFATITLKKWLKDNNVQMYSTHNEGKSVVAERFIRTLKNKIYQHMTNDIVDKYKNTYHRTIKIKPIDLGDDSFAEYNEESNEKDPKFKVVIMSGFQSTKIFLLKDIFLIGVKVFLSLKKIKDTLPWTYVISDLNGEEIVRSFYEKELQKTNQKEFIIEQVIKRKGNKSYVKWKGYNNSFNSWIDEKDRIKRVNTFHHIEVLEVILKLN